MFWNQNSQFGGHHTAQGHIHHLLPFLPVVKILQDPCLCGTRSTDIEREDDETEDEVLEDEDDISRDKGLWYLVS